MTARGADHTGPAAASGPADDAATIVAAAQEWALAIVANDAGRIGAFMTDDWAIVSETGISPRADFLGVVASGDLTHSAMQMISEPDVRILGDTALLTARVTNTAHFGGRHSMRTNGPRTSGSGARDAGSARAATSPPRGMPADGPPSLLHVPATRPYSTSADTVCGCSAPEAISAA